MKKARGEKVMANNKVSQIGGFLKMLLMGRSAGNEVPVAVDTDGHLQIDIKTKGSIILSFCPVISSADTAVADGTTGLVIPSILNGCVIKAATASVYTAGAVAGTTDIQIRRRRGNAVADVLSTKITISTTDYTASDGVINTDNDDLQTGDIIFVDIDAITTTAAKGLFVSLEIE